MMNEFDSPCIECPGFLYLCFFAMMLSAALLFYFPYLSILLFIYLFLLFYDAYLDP